MTLVVDASVVFAALTATGDLGRWARNQVTADQPVAPEHMPAEVANILRRAVLRGELSSDFASLAHQELLEMPVALFSYVSVAGRAWELRHNLSIQDGWYVAIAEQLGAPLATLDRKLVMAPGPQCEFRFPPQPDSYQTGME